MPKLRQFVPQKVCLACQGCCRFNEEKSVWQPYQIKLIPYKDFFICPHLNLKDNHCRIYLEHPFDCQLYPFLLNKHQGKTYLALDKKCSYVGQDKSAGKKFQGYREYLLEFFKDPEVKKFLKENPGLIAEYKDAEVENLERIDI